MNSMTSGKGTTLRNWRNRSSTKYNVWPTLMTGKIRIDFDRLYPLHIMPNAAVEQQRGDDCLRRAICPKYLAGNHGRGLAPVQGVALVGVVLTEISPVSTRE